MFKFLFALSIVAMTTMLIGIISTSAFADTSAHKCVLRGIPVAAYANVKIVELDIQTGSLDCHANEPDCAPQGKTSGYPPQLRPNKLIAIFRPLVEKRILQHLSSYVSPDRVCHPPELRISVPLPKSDPLNAPGPAASTDPNTLTFTVKVSIFKNTKPPIAVLTSSVFRPDHFISVSDTNMVVQPIPLNASNEDFAALLTAFAHRAIGGVPTLPPATP